MHDEIDGWIDELSDRSSGWVTRRDAAEHLGQAGGKAVGALHGNAEDDDRDVRDAVVRALGLASAGLEGIAPVTGSRTYDLDELANSLQKTGRREVEAKGDGFEVAVTLKEGRSQRVYIEPATSPAEKKTIRVWTRCGESRDGALKWALRNNRSLSHCALALQEEDGVEYLIMVNSFLEGAVTPAELKSSVKEIAYYGDWVEKKLTGGDEF